MHRLKPSEYYQYAEDLHFGAFWNDGDDRRTYGYLKHYHVDYPYDPFEEEFSEKCFQNYEPLEEPRGMVV